MGVLPSMLSVSEKRTERERWMKGLKKNLVWAVVAGLLSVATAGAARIGTAVNTDIAVDTTWTKAGSPYYLVGDIYVLPGASLTIEEGVVVASYYDDLGSLCVTRGAKIFILGTQEESVIFTSAEDVATWAGSVVVRGGSELQEEPGKYSVSEIQVLGNPKTGVWRPVCNEWGGLAIMGSAYISHSHYGDVPVVWTDENGNPVTNKMYPDGLNRAQMEGTVKSTPTDQRVYYGGDDDDDDSGVIRYLSVRYGGRDTEPQKELNGLSLGGIGRSTDISHVEVMNNVDDGIEIWGGTVNIRYATIWNVGDDSFDCDQGWRGSLNYALIVQGYSRTTVAQGGGVGDNAFEMDGAEISSAQPMLTARINHVTVVGQPYYNAAVGFQRGSRGATTWRDNARVQYDNCIFIDTGIELIRFDNADTDGGVGYDATASKGNSGSKLRDNRPVDGTLNWIEHWTTSFNGWKSGAYYPTAAQLGWPGTTSDLMNLLDDVYSYIPEGYELDKPLCNITNSIVYGGGSANLLNEYNALIADGADFSGNDVAFASLPIQGLYRGPDVQIDLGSTKKYTMQPVVFLNPLPVAGVTAGAFTGCNWLGGWTAADAYRMTDTTMNGASADLDCDGRVDLNDLTTFSMQWLQ